MSARSAHKPRQEERQKKISDLYYVQGYTEERIAELMGISRKTVVRDLQCLKMSQTEHLNPEFARTLVARLTARMEYVVSGIMRELPQLKSKERVLAGGVASRVIKEQAELYDKLGVLELSKTAIEEQRTPEEQSEMDLMVEKFLEQWNAEHRPKKPEGID